MIEPSVGFTYPDEAPDAEAARMAGRGESWRLLLELLSAAPNPKVRIAALRYMSNPQERTVAEIARELGVSRMTLHRELKAMRGFRVLHTLRG